MFSDKRSNADLCLYIWLYFTEMGIKMSVKNIRNRMTGATQASKRPVTKYDCLEPQLLKLRYDKWSSPATNRQWNFFCDKRTLWTQFYIQKNRLRVPVSSILLDSYALMWNICSFVPDISLVGQLIGLQNLAFESVWLERGAIIWIELFAGVLSQWNMWLFCCEFRVRKRLDRMLHKYHSKAFTRIRAPCGFVYISVIWNFAQHWNLHLCRVWRLVDS
jgi:hypothetical protein